MSERTDARRLERRPEQTVAQQLAALDIALSEALEITRLVEREGRPAVATTGRWRVQPGWPSIVPELTEFSLDLRHPDLTVRDRLLDEAHALCQSIAARRMYGHRTEQRGGSGDSRPRIAGRLPLRCGRVCGDVEADA